jgi:hypothetical protein
MNLLCEQQHLLALQWYLNLSDIHFAWNVLKLQAPAPLPLETEIAIILTVSSGFDTLAA